MNEDKIEQSESQKNKHTYDSISIKHIVSSLTRNCHDQSINSD